MKGSCLSYGGVFWSDGVKRKRGGGIQLNPRPFAVFRYSWVRFAVLPASRSAHGHSVVPPPTALRQVDRHGLAVDVHAGELGPIKGDHDAVVTRSGAAV